MDEGTVQVWISGVSLLVMLLGIFGGLIVIGRRDQVLTDIGRRAEEDRQNAKDFFAKHDVRHEQLLSCTNSLAVATANLATSDTHHLKTVCRIEDILKELEPRLREVEIETTRIKTLLTRKITDSPSPR